MGFQPRRWTALESHPTKRLLNSYAKSWQAMVGSRTARLPRLYVGHVCRTPEPICDRLERHGFLVRRFQDLFHRGVALKCFHDTVFKHRPHTEQSSLTTKILRGFTPE